MEYEGLTHDDLVNVKALNRAWLTRFAPPELRPASPRRLDRLAGTPFLLFSFGEGDAATWGRLLAENPQTDLFTSGIAAETRELQSAALGFLWGLARRNPYVARVVSGASLHWCDQLAAQTLVHALACAANADLLEPRFASDTPMFRRLFQLGSAAVKDAHRAAQLAALQAMLTAGDNARLGRLPAAACRMPGVAARVADKL